MGKPGLKYIYIKQLSCLNYLLWTDDMKIKENIVTSRVVICEKAYENWFDYLCYQSWLTFFGAHPERTPEKWFAIACKWGQSMGKGRMVIAGSVNSDFKPLEN